MGARPGRQSITVPHAIIPPPSLGPTNVSRPTRLDSLAATSTMTRSQGLRRPTTPSQIHMMPASKGDGALAWRPPGAAASHTLGPIHARNPFEVRRRANPATTAANQSHTPKQLNAPGQAGVHAITASAPKQRPSPFAATRRSPRHRSAFHSHHVPRPPRDTSPPKTEHSGRSVARTRTSHHRLQQSHPTFHDFQNGTAPPVCARNRTGPLAQDR